MIKNLETEYYHTLTNDNGMTILFITYIKKYLLDALKHLSYYNVPDSYFNVSQRD